MSIPCQLSSIHKLGVARFYVVLFILFYACTALQGNLQYVNPRTAL